MIILASLAAGIFLMFGNIVPAILYPAVTPILWLILGFMLFVNSSLSIFMPSVDIKLVTQNKLVMYFLLIFSVLFYGSILVYCFIPSITLQIMIVAVYIGGSFIVNRILLAGLYKDKN